MGNKNNKKGGLLKLGLEPQVEVLLIDVGSQ